MSVDSLPRGPHDLPVWGIERELNGSRKTAAGVRADGAHSGRKRRRRCREPTEELFGRNHVFGSPHRAEGDPSERRKQRNYGPAPGKSSGVCPNRR